MDGLQNRLLACPFDYQLFKNGSVQISYEGRAVSTLCGKEALRFCARVEVLSQPEQQLLMAKATGNFKRGNEKQADRRPSG